ARMRLNADDLDAARQELAAARRQLGSNRGPHADLIGEVERLDLQLAKVVRFEELVDRSFEAEFPLPFGSTSSQAAGSMVSPPKAGAIPDIERNRPIPFILGALDLYEIPGRDDWLPRLEQGLLASPQVTRIRRMAYGRLLRLADHTVHTSKDPRDA